MTTLNAGIAAIPNGSPERARTYGWRTNVSLTFSFDMAILAVLGCAGSSILWWLTNERYPQLLALAGVAIFFTLSAISHLALRRWHESAISRER